MQITTEFGVMLALPAPGLNAMHDDYMQGNEGFDIARSSRGVLELLAAKRILAAGCFMAASLPAEEALVPIDRMVQRLFFSTMVAMVLAAVLTRWLLTRLLRRQFAPLLAAGRPMAERSGAGQQKFHKQGRNSSLSALRRTPTIRSLLVGSASALHLFTEILIPMSLKNAVISTLLLLGLSSISAAAPSAELPVKGGTLTASWGGLEPQALFVPAGGGSSPLLTSTKILERLLRLEGDFSFTPLLAESVKASADFKSYTVKLRHGVKWHDGQDFTSADVVYNAIEYWKPIAVGVALKSLRSVDAPDPSTVVFRLDAPIPEFAFKSILASALVIPKHLYAGRDIHTNPINNTPVGTGPFKFKAWVRGSHVEYLRNEQYWNPAQPYLDKLIIRWWRDPASRAAALESGAVDLATFNPVPVPDLARLTSRGDFVVDKHGYENSAWVATIEFNQRRDNVNKREVRQALLQAIDRRFIANTIYYKQAIAAVGPIPSSNALFFTADVAQYAFDPAKAGKALDAAGYPVKDGWRFTVNLVAAGWFEENVKLGQYVKQALEDVKVKVNLQVLDRPTSLKRIYGDYDYDIALSNNAGSVELVPSLTQFYTTDGIVKGAAFRNATGFSRPEVDRIVERLSVETNPTKRKQIAHEFARIIATEAPMLPLVEIEPYTVARKAVRGHSKSANFMGEGWGEVWLAR